MSLFESVFGVSLFCVRKRTKGIMVGGFVVGVGDGRRILWLIKINLGWSRFACEADEKIGMHI